MQHKKCNKCKKNKDLSLFYKDKNKKDGLFIWCKKCKDEANKKTYFKYKESYLEKDREYNRNNPEKRKKYYDRQRLKNPLKTSAVFKLNYAVKTGKIIKNPCSICGNKKSQGHHEDYSKPLCVIWLCSYHHKEEHKRMKENNLFY